MSELLRDRAVLASLTIKKPGMSVQDRVVSDEVANLKEASKDAGRYNKQLFSKQDMKAVNKAAGEARIIHRKWTKAWTNDGTRILPALAIDDYTRDMKLVRDKFEEARREFIADYPNMVERAKLRLGEMFNDTDYPDVDVIESQFDYDTQILPVPSGDDFRVNMSQAQQQMYKEQIERITLDAMAKAQNDTWQQIIAAVSRMSTSLKAFDPNKKGAERHVFRDSLVDNVRELAVMLPKLNLTNSNSMHEITARIEAELCGVDAQDLRENETDRQIVAESAEDILANIQQVMV